MSNPVLPRITLRRSDHEVEIIDPRPDPRTLGARYVHGCYIAAWRVGGRCLTAGPTRHWTPYDGRGLPETFELPLGWAMAREHEHFLRVGAGQMRKTPYNGTDGAARAALVATVEWTVTGQSDEHLVMTTSDGAQTPEWNVSYVLERAVRLTDDGLESRTTLTLRCPNLVQHPVAWFAHPFFAQGALGATALELPTGGDLVQRTVSPNLPRGGPGPGSLAKGADGRWRFGEGLCRSTIGGLWGSRDGLMVHLDPALGGGRVAIAVDRPLDHLVVWGAPHVFSPEPKLCRLWVDGEAASWAIRYRFLP